MQTATPYLNFDGTCREAMKLYADTFECELFQMTFAEAPVPCGPDAGDRMMHASLTRDGRTFLMAGDTMPGMAFQAGNNFSVHVTADTADEVDRWFAALSRNGKTVMPLQETFWASRFGMVTDPFGVQWMLSSGGKDVPLQQ